MSVPVTESNFAQHGAKAVPQVLGSSYARTAEWATVSDSVMLVTSTAPDETMRPEQSSDTLLRAESFTEDYNKLCEIANMPA